MKLRGHLELELDERGQVDNVLSFFLNMKSKADEKLEDFLDDD